MLLLIVLLPCGCRESEVGGEGYSFTDDLGRTVTVSSSDRVAALLGSFADMWMLAGGEVVATADDAFEDLCLDLPQGTVNLGSTHRPAVELLLMSSPDLVLASSKLSRHLELEGTLEDMGVAVAYFDVDCFDSFLRVFGIMTSITGRDDLYAQYGEGQRERIDASLAKYRDREACSVLVLRASADSIRAKASDSTMLGGMLRDYGCQNIADSDTGLLENLNIESIVQMNPDKIFFVEAGDSSDAIRAAVERMFDENPLWRSLDAVSGGEVYFMDKRLYNLKPNSRFAEAYEKLGLILYEE